MRFKTIKTELACLICESIFPISRKAHKKKGENHLKNLWCYRCEKVTTHIENLRIYQEPRHYYVSANSKDIIEDDDTDWEELFK